MIREIAKPDGVYHHLRNRDFDDMTATCSKCGPVEMVVTSDKRPRCFISVEDSKYQKYLGWCARVYNLPLKQVQKLLEDFYVNGCALCGRKDQKPNVEHCHTTGKVRGVVCSRRNTGLAQFQDNIGLLKRAIEYLGGSADA